MSNFGFTKLIQYYINCVHSYDDEGTLKTGPIHAYGANNLPKTKPCEPLAFDLQRNVFFTCVVHTVETKTKGLSTMYSKFLPT